MKTMMNKGTLLLMLIGALFSCTKDNAKSPKTIDMRINHYQDTGIGEGLYLTMLVQTGDAIGTDKWTKMYGGIEGFDYKPGYIYDLSVEVENIDNPPPDGSSTKTALKKVRSMEEVNNDTSFDISLKINGQNFVTNTAGYSLLNQIDIDCNNLCNALNTKLMEQDMVIGTFQHVNENSIKLIDIK